MTKKSVDNFIDEATIMRFLQHRNVMKFRGIAILEFPLLIQWNDAQMEIYQLILKSMAIYT